jgi:hypothetical protein
MTRALKIGVWFAVAAVVGVASARGSGHGASSAAPPAARLAPAR